MARKRKLDASIPDESLNRPVDTENEPKSKMGGMWAGSAMNMLKQRIDDAHGSLQAGILGGTVALELSAEQIEDSVGSDRVTDWEADEDFQLLVANIKRRGQTQPIRVRPANVDWRPNDDNPLETKDKFYIQSGRRRLQAAKTLGRPVLAVVSTDAGDAMQADLEERFHENTMRRDLNGFEELISIGALALGLPDLTQVEVAERLGVPQGDVSLGLACLEYREDILEQMDVSTAPKRSYRAVIPKLKRGERLTPLLPPSLTGDAPLGYDVRGVPMVAKKAAGGYAVSIKKVRVAEADMEAMLVDLAKVVLRYQIKGK